MTSDELTSYMRRRGAASSDWHAPRDPKDPDATEPFGDLRDDVWHALSYLLARRLAREGHLDEARRYMPAALLARFEEYRGLIRRGRDKKRPADSRSLNLWQPARIHRYLGMELFGTETAPDWSYFEGESRAGRHWRHAFWNEAAPHGRELSHKRWNGSKGRKEGDSSARRKIDSSPTSVPLPIRRGVARLGSRSTRSADEATARMLCTAAGSRAGDRGRADNSMGARGSGWRPNLLGVEAEPGAGFRPWQTSHSRK